MVSFFLKKLFQLFVTLIGNQHHLMDRDYSGARSPIALTMDPKVSPVIIEQMMKITILINRFISNTTCGLRSFLPANFTPSRMEGRSWKKIKRKDLEYPPP